MAALTRLGRWGAGAVLALLIAVLATRSDYGARRVALAVGTAPAPAIARSAPENALARATDSESDMRRLTDTMRSLTADRDRLLARVTVLERNFEDMTGSIGRGMHAPPNPAPMLPPGPSIGAAVSAPIELPAPAEGAAIAPAAPGPEVDTIATRTDFGVDIGSAANLAALREVWRAARRNHSGLLDGLRPVIAIRDGQKGSVELRLIVGPLNNAAAAARLCASLAAAGLSCQPAVFDGQKLALR